MNKIELSQLQQLDFAVLQSELKFIPESTTTSKGEPFEELPLLADFELKKSTEDEVTYRLYLKLVINKNQENVIAGYSIQLLTASTFCIKSPENLSEKDLNNLKGVSMLSLAISDARGYLRSITSFSPLGSYNLPPIDVYSMLKSKVSQKIKAKKPKTKS